MVTVGVDRAREVAESVTDPELPLLTLAELGVLREVRTDPAGRVVVSITPTYTGCPALETMRDDLRTRLRAAGFAEVEVRTVLDPAGPVPLRLGQTRARVPCPRCGSADTDELSRFGATACRSLHRCHDCREPFEHFKEL
jgi:ring-1,2-phenylacetyl-CoA epoxidase subunit PaaD